MSKLKSSVHSKNIESEGEIAGVDRDTYLAALFPGYEVVPAVFRMKEYTYNDIQGEEHSRRKGIVWVLMDL